MSTEVGFLKPKNKLQQLKESGAIALTVSQMGLPKTAKKKDAVIFIAETKVYGLDSQHLIISIPGHGAALVEIGKIKAESLYMAGLTMKAAKLLKSEIDKLYNE